MYAINVIKENVAFCEEVAFTLCGLKVKTVAPDIDKYLNAFEYRELKELIKEKKAIEDTKLDLVARVESNITTEVFLFWRESENNENDCNTWRVELIEV